ncbi:hypothetical protein LMG33818_000212 [Halomonadaceae bacterium LMG 33818]
MKNTGPIENVTSGSCEPFFNDQIIMLSFIHTEEGFMKKSAVTAVPAAPSALAEQHFATSFTYETDCWDVHEALSTQNDDFVLLDVRSPELFAKGHIRGAINLPHRKIIRSALAKWPEGTLFITYCAGPHCNGAARGALRLATLERPVKIMAGGITGWIDEGFPLEQSGT